MNKNKRKKTLNVEMDEYLYFRLNDLSHLIRKTKTSILEDLLDMYFTSLENDDISGYQKHLQRVEREFLEETGYNPNQLGFNSQLRSRLLREYGSEFYWY